MCRDPLCMWRFPLFYCICEQPLPPVLSFPSLLLYDGGVGFSIGDRNRQVFRCVMFDMLTQHAFITGRRQVWQQRLPGHDYIISWCAAEGQGRAPQSKTKHLWDSGSRRLKSLKKCSGFVFTVHCTPSCLDILHLLVLGGNFSERWPICDIHK